MPPKSKKEYRPPSDATNVRILVPGTQLFNKDASECDRKSSYVYQMITSGMQMWPRPVAGLQWGLKCIYKPHHEGNEYFGVSYNTIFATR